MDDLIAPDLLTLAAEKWPERTALRVGSDTWTFADLDYGANEVAGRVRGGSRIAFRAEMSVASVVTIWGVPRGGGVAVPIDPALDATAAAALAGSLGATLGWPPAGAGDYPMPTPERPVVIVRTSGTSGAPRGVVLTAGNVAAAAAASQIHLGTRESDLWLLVMPLHHVGGMCILWRAAHDGSGVLLQPGFAPGEVSEALRSGVTWVSLVPTMLHRLLRESDGPWPTVRGALVGGAHTPAGLIGAARAAGLMALPSYGMSETTAQVATVRPGNAAAAVGTVGHPLPGVQVSIDGGPGEPGLISVAGPTVSPGYVDEPPRDGPFVTEDVGYFDSGGRLVVIGRRDDVVITGGENVHPGRVERALIAHDAVDDVVVVGVPDPEWGQKLVAAFTGRDVEAHELQAFLARNLSRHEVPKVIRLMPALPLLSTGKVDREAIRREAAGW